jgi:hypothetical protein
MITRNSLIERTSYVIERTLLPVLTDWEDIMNECADIFHLRGHNTGLGGHHCWFYLIERTLSKIARANSCDSTP